MITDIHISGIVEYLATEINREFAAITKEDTIAVARAIPWRPDLPTEQFPLLACYMTGLTGQIRRAQLRWHLQFSTAAFPAQQSMLAWGSVVVRDLLERYPDVDPCVLMVDNIVIDLGIVAIGGGGGTNAYPTLSCDFEFQPSGFGFRKAA